MCPAKKAVTRKANKINYFAAVVPPPEPPDWSNLTTEYREQLREHDEWIDWLNQFFPAKIRSLQTHRRIYLVVGTESYPEQIWSMRHDRWNGIAYLEWEAAALPATTP